MAGIGPNVPPELRWRTKDIANCFPASARLPLMMARAADPAAGSGAHKALARTLLELGRADAAWEALAPALTSPDPDTLLLAGNIHRQAGRIDSAIGCLRGVLESDSQSVAAIDGLARCLERQKNHGEALAVLEQGLRRKPGHPELWASLTRIAVSARNAAFLERVLAELPLPHRYVACIDDARNFLFEQAGDRAHLERRLRAPALVSKTRLLSEDDPLLAAVLEEVSRIQDFVADPYDKTTAGGVQAAFALAPDRPAWSALFSRIARQIEHYLSALRAVDAPFRLPSGEVGLRSWVVRLGNGGRQRHHLHPTGWITGVIYLKVPPEVANAEGGAGCLEMPFLPHNSFPDWPKTLYRPAAGGLLLFPSYLRHATIPFQSEHERVCIAFDLLAL
ncbi:MAG TPA: putative 2OG-Fe(II) oxygenase [Magnetospirillum sp.]|nr:putative 2OG-Fe(II) oxygenase [Magnetospirillum sp.]